MRAINVCGYGNTGCTALIDFLSDFYGVGFVHIALHEIGMLKCQYSFAGGIINILNGKGFIPTKQQLGRSLRGIAPDGPLQLNESASLHLQMRARVAKLYGEKYESIVENSIAFIPNDIHNQSKQDLLNCYKQAASAWVKGIAKHIPASHFLDHDLNMLDGIMMFKNDPPGSYPVLAPLITNGTTGAMLRDPRDTAYDFNRHYKIAINDNSIKKFVAHYNSQIASAKQQILKFEDEIHPFYFVIDFENLVSSESVQEKVMSKMLGNRKKIRSKFNPKQSSKNICMYKNLEPNLLKYVEEHCMDLYNEYHVFLRDREMIIE